MTSITANRFDPDHAARLHALLRAVTRMLLFAPLAFAISQGDAHAQERATEQPGATVPANSLEGIATWINKRFTAAEIGELSAADFRIESRACGCTDQPDPHFPYVVVLFTTPKGDLIARAEGQENGAKFTPLAVRIGNQYCNVDEEEQCYGSFANVCEFTDFRYGAYLQEFFPTCK